MSLFVLRPGPSKRVPCRCHQHSCGAVARMNARLYPLNTQFFSIVPTFFSPKAPNASLVYRTAVYGVAFGPTDLFIYFSTTPRHLLGLVQHPATRVSASQQCAYCRHCLVHILTFYHLFTPPSPGRKTKVIASGSFGNKPTVLHVIKANLSASASGNPLAFSASVYLRTIAWTIP